jgi:hypothetical protein
MRFPEAFSHTRQEQYLMLLPVGLLTDVELAARQEADGRFRRYFQSLVAPYLDEALSRGLTVGEFAEEFVAKFEGPLPPVFERPPS